MAMYRKVVFVCVIYAGCLINYAHTTTCSSIGFAQGTHCFVAGRAYEDFFSAQILCRSYGCRLVLPEDAAALNDLKAFALANSMTELFLGGVDFASEGTYVDASTGIEAPYINWGPSEPNGGRNENCLVVDQISDMRTIDSGCSTGKRFVCECPVLDA